MKQIDINASIPLAGYYNVIVRKAGTDEVVRELGPFKNDITDIGLNRLGTDTAIFYCYAGSGTTPAAETDTQMGNLLGYTNSLVDQSTSKSAVSPYWVQGALTFRFVPAGVNRNYTEVGVGWNTTSVNGLWSRALIVDSIGNPVTLTVLADEYLDVVYSLRYYPPLTDSSYLVNISGVDYDFVTRAMQIESSVGIFPYSSAMSNQIGLNVYGGTVTLGPLTGFIGYTGMNAVLGTAFAQAYVDGSLERTYSCTANLSAGNVGGIAGITGGLTNGMIAFAFQTSVSPAIPKDNTKSLTLGFNFSWDRV